MEQQYILLAEGLLHVGLAGVLLGVRFGDRLNRIFALFLLLHGGRQICRFFDGTAFSTDDLDRSVFWLARYLNYTAPFVLVYLTAAYVDRFRPTAWRRAMFVVCVSGAALMIVAVMRDHAVFVGRPWLELSFIGLNMVAPNFLAAIMAHMALASSDAGARRSLLMASLGMSFGVTAFALHLGIPGLMDYTDKQLTAAWLGLVPILYVVSRVAPLCRTPDLALRADCRQFLAVLGLVAASVLMLAAVRPWLGPKAMSVTMISTMAAWFGLGALLVAYSILRREVFGIGTGTHATVRRGAVASAFVLVFLIASQIAETWAQGATSGLGGISWLAGSIAAGVLLFALSPLEKAARVVADIAVPDGTVRPEHRRAELYVSAVRVALEDGRLQPADRRMLDRLRTRLALTKEAALGLEADARRRSA